MEHYRAFDPLDPAPVGEERSRPGTMSSCEVLEAVCKSHADTILLDFDNTLFLDNSTERFLDSVRPQTLAFLLVLAADMFTRLASKSGLCRYDVWRDPIRVWVCCMFFPWSLIQWRRITAVHLRSKQNRLLLDSLPAQGRLIIISYGFQAIIAPLLADFRRPYTLVCSRLWPFKANLRHMGKIEALQQAEPGLVLEKTLFVTDSSDDRELLEAIPESYLVQWQAVSPKAFHRLYVPLRYTLEGKYPGRHYGFNQILMEDFLILLLMFPFDLRIWLMLPALFLSLHAIYEIGYYENDFRAAPQEKNPCVSADIASFAEYPIYRAWYWAIPLAGMGFILRALSEPVGMGAVAVSFGLWTALLVVLYGVFRFFNYLPVWSRPWIFPILHLIKNGAYALCIPLTPLGIPLLAAQVLSQTAHYTVYRRTGTTDHFNRHAIRLFLFLGFIAIEGILQFLSFQQVWSLPMAIIMAWCILRAIERAYRMNFFMMIFRALRNTGYRSRS